MRKRIQQGIFLAFLLLGILLTGFFHTVLAQDQQDLDKIIKASRTEQLGHLSETLQARFDKKHSLAISQAKKNGWIIMESGADGKSIELRELGNHGMPVYFSTANLNAAKTVSTNKVWSGGSAGLNLSGTGITLREWDESAPRPTHQELTGRVSQGDAGTYVALHSTHVAGTLLATGIVPNSHGMANQALLRAFDWNNDYSEMASEAAAGALLSNSSYIFISGWYYSSPYWYWYGDPAISPVEDYNFGFYSSDAATVDSIAYYAPYYLPCKASGNDKGEGPPVQPVSHYMWDGNNWVLSTAVRNLDGMPSGYDCIASGWGVSKNVLTVGAVNAIPAGYSSPPDVVIAPFSGTGPTDDGRIKPDIVADGIGLYSTGSASDNDYVTMSGTSMATPNVTGSLALLQQHYHNLKGSYMQAASLKGLVIHTADEAGSSPGPDYIYGWGLLNTAKAAALISSTTALISENTLMNQSTYTLKINSNGTDPLKATICWTDPPGNPPPASLNPPTIMLVNDLDVRIDGSTYKPWVLNPANPSQAATTGDNFRDNIEQVYIANPGTGCHTLTVTHKGMLAGSSQAFSLILSGITIYPSFVVGSVSGNQSICTNILPGLLTAIPPTGGSAPYSYQWQRSVDSITFTDIAGATGINYQPSQLTATTFYRQVQTSVESCNHDTTNVIKIRINPLPGNAQSIAGPQSVCAGSSDIQYFVAPVHDALTYIWNLPVGAFITSGQLTDSIRVDFSEQAVSGDFQVYGNNLCGNGNPSTDYPVSVIPVPATPTIIQQGDSLISDALNGNQWYNSSGPVFGATLPVFYPTENGKYMDIATVNDCASAPSDWINFVSISVEQKQAVAITFFPNPADQLIHIKLTGLTSLPNVKIDLLNLDGIIVWSESMDKRKEGVISINIDCADLAEGIYFLRIHSGDENLFRKIIIQRKSN